MGVLAGQPHTTYIGLLQGTQTGSASSAGHVIFFHFSRPGFGLPSCRRIAVRACEQTGPR